MAVHTKSVHNRIKNISCPEGNYQTSIKSRLIQQMKVIHNGSRALFCSKCSFKAYRKDFLIKHKNEVHQEKQGFQIRRKRSKHRKKYGQHFLQESHHLLLQKTQNTSHLNNFSGEV